MKFERIEIRHWRQFREVSFALPKEASLICIVGENGTGKTSLFELLASCATRLGLSPGVSLIRGDVFAERHDFSLTYKVTLTSDSIFRNTALAPDLVDIFATWDHTLTLRSVNVPENPSENSYQVYAGSNPAEPSMQRLAMEVINGLRSQREVLYLFLDADRSYPPVGFNASQFAQELQTLDVKSFAKQRSFLRSNAIYEEWERLTLVSYNKIATDFYEKARKASELGLESPKFVDDFKLYRDAIRVVLPHLRFVGRNTNNTGLLFNSSGLDLPFANLSGGEREVAFIIGQIERFQLKSGLLMIDEPELHLNPDLVRTWIGFLRGNVENGQVWIATHSMEAVEASGADNTFVLTRDPDTRTIFDAYPLSSRPLMATLSAALGTPGFSIQLLCFVFVEGEAHRGDAQAYYDIYGDITSARFIASGNARDVVRRHDIVSILAETAQQQLFSGGIVDRDFRSDDECKRIVDAGVLVLPCHEIENLFLHPDSLQNAIDQTGSGANATLLTLQSSDEQAGRWVFQMALASINYNSELSREVREKRNRAWQQLKADETSYVDEISSALANDTIPKKQLEEALRLAIDEYKDTRTRPDLWRRCFGKEVFRSIAVSAGYANPSALQRSITRSWSKGHATVPQEVLQIREYLTTTCPSRISDPRV